MVKNATELVVLIENLLGWSPDPALPLWKARSIEAGKLNREIKNDPTRITLANLELTVHYLHRQRKPVHAPRGVVHFVDEALKVTAEPVTQDATEKRVDEVLILEREAEHPGYESWIGRLIRVAASHRAALLAEWETERGPLWAK